MGRHKHAGRMHAWKTGLIALAALVVSGAGLGLVALYEGWYDVSAVEQHTAPVYWLLHTGMRESVERRAQTVLVPALADPDLAGRGLAHFREHCVRCHGAPGVAPEPFALGLRPLPADLSYTAREWKASELFWAIKHGIKMTGMPAWEYRLADDDIWSIVAFLQVLPTLSPQQYRAMQPTPVEHRAADSHGPRSAARGAVAVLQYGCITCHRIPGIVGAEALVGPPLEGFARRSLIAGRLPNTPANLVQWIRAPQAVKPGTAMPDLGVSERDAADIEAFLHGLR